MFSNLKMQRILPDDSLQG